jgi:2-isopropylmalate synthase
VARQLERLAVDVIEAGFPCISDGDFEAVQTIATEIKKCKIAGLARCVKSDIEAAAAALKPAGDRARIHVFLATSKLHREFKLKKASDEILRMAEEGVAYAKTFVDDIEFSPEDASRTELPFLAQVVETVIRAGATTVNIPDTVGYTTPDEFYQIIRYLKENVPNINDAVISVHCHNDLGLATANSLAAIKAGARQVEGTINGIGERAGNVALEEVAMVITTRKGIYGDVYTGINTTEIVRSSRIVERMSGLHVQRSKAIVGENAFAHSSGIHQHGILNKRETYEIIDPQSVGWGATELPLTKHSGRAAVQAKLAQLGHVLSDEEMKVVFERFKKVGDSKKFVYDDDLSAIVDASLHESLGLWELNFVQFVAGSDTCPTATVGLTKGGEKFVDSAIGNGAVDAAFRAIERITNREGSLVDYSVNAASAGQDAVGEVTVHVDFGASSKPLAGKGASTDIIEASARAFLNALNRSLHLESRAQQTPTVDCEEARGI